MKFGNFNLSTYRHLPLDYHKKYDSIWIDIDQSLLDPVKLGQNYNETLSELEHAASVGFDIVGVNEHHNNFYGFMPSPNIMAAALSRSERARQAAVLVLGASLALYNPPMRVAEEFAMLDCISGGRLIAGFPVGTPMDTCFAYGTNPSELRDRYYEAHDLVMRAWMEKESFTFHGRFNQQRYVNITPRTIQKPHPPVWIPAGGSVETWEFCAQRDYLYAYLTYYGYQSGEKSVRGFWDKMKELGKEPNPFQVAITQFVGVAETLEEAQKLYAQAADYFFSICLHVDPRWSAPPGYASEATVAANLFSQLRGAAHGAKLNAEIVKLRSKTFEEMVDAGYVIIGTPDQVADQLRKIAISQNVGNMLLITSFGNLPTETAKYNATLVGEKVLPQIRDIFEGQWENRWYPQGATPGGVRN